MKDDIRHFFLQIPFFLRLRLLADFSSFSFHVMFGILVVCVQATLASPHVPDSATH
jgi:hypothetical protein